MWTISSGLPNRPVGLRASRIRFASSSLTSQSMSSGVSTGPGQIAFVRTPLRPELDGEASGQREQRALRGRVGVLRDRAAEQRHEARDVDDRARALLDHLRDRVLAAEEDAADVDRHDLVPGRDVRVDDRVVGLGHDPGVVVEDVDPTVRGDRVLDHLPGAGLGRDVDLDEASPCRRRLATWRTVSSPASSLNSATTTLAPSAANIFEATRPMPPPAPVMTQTLPSSRIHLLRVADRGQSYAGRQAAIVAAPRPRPRPSPPRPGSGQSFIREPFIDERTSERGAISRGDGDGSGRPLSCARGSARAPSRGRPSRRSPARRARR